MCTSMNYQKIYDTLVSRAGSRPRKDGVYYERHHIIPRCLGGNDSSDNIACLTAEEHYLAHQLLVKLHPGHYGICFAAFRMTTHTGGGRMTNRLYGWIRKRLAQNVPKRGPMAQEVKTKLSAAKKGKGWGEGMRASMAQYYSTRVMSNEERVNRSVASTGRTHSEETKRKISEAMTGKSRPDHYRKKMSEYWRTQDVSRLHTPEARAKAAESLRGRPKSEDHRRKLAEANVGKKASDDTRKKLSDTRRGVAKSEEHNAAVARSKTGTKKIEVSQGTFRMLNPDQLRHFAETGEYLTSKQLRKLNERVSN